MQQSSTLYVGLDVHKDEKSLCLSRAWKRERSARWRASAAGGGSARDLEAFRLPSL
jgi:hypothetical protein